MTLVAMGPGVPSQSEPNQAGLAGQITDRPESPAFSSQIELSPIRNTVISPVSFAEREPAPPLPTGTLTPEKIPAAAKPQPIPLFRLLMPIVMVAALGGMVALMLISRESSSGGQAVHPMMLIFPLMAVMSMVSMFGTPTNDDADEIRRAYLRHLGILRQKALKNADMQRKHELHLHPDPIHLWSMTGSLRMWERGTQDPDALEIRLGLGTTALCTPLQVGDSGAVEDLDPVCAVALRHTVRSVGAIQQMPITVQLRAFRYIALSGPGARGLARAIVCQLAYHHGPECVGVSSIGGGWDWLKWLPHTRDIDAATYRILIVDSTTTTGMESFLDDPKWTTIIDVESRAHTALGARALTEGLALTVEDSLTVHTADGLEDIGNADALSEIAATHMARSMTPFMRPSALESRTSGELLPLLGISSLGELDPATMWPERGKRRLAVPIGVSSTGAPIVLDIKESAHGGIGPHGLCVGATGSGKSELLKTLVLSLAATHSPDDLNLVLVDFKGGATFLGLESLPHTSAVITNLSEEATLVERMQDAISGEMNRRQELLRSAGNFANVGDYNAARSERPELAPLPSLVIVIDEFSELLGQHPDFADLFVAVGRLGRSLHMHLLLASQRLEEGRLRGLDSHLSYRIGLKTFSAAESRQVLGVPDAYQLPAQPGAGFLKSDADDVVRFQASYVSGEVPIEGPSESVSVLAKVQEFTGWDWEPEPQQLQLPPNQPTVKLLDAVVEKAQTAALMRGMTAHTIWLPPLPSEVPLAGVADDVGALAASIGIIDRPFLQRQDAFTLSFQGAGGHAALCGGPQTGKTTALRSLVLSLAATHSTNAVRFYVLDLAGTGLGALERIPHAAGVAHRGDEERVRRVVDEVRGLIEEPENCATFLIIDGWHVIASEFEDLVEPITGIVADGLSANIHVVISTQRWTALRPAIRDLIAHRIELKLSEPMDSLIDRKEQIKVPAAPGRGLTPEGEQMLIANSTNQDIAHVVMASDMRGDTPVQPLKMLPKYIRLDELPSSEATLPWGIGGTRLHTMCWDPRDAQHVLCIGSNGSGKSTFLRTLGHGICKLGRDDARLVILDHRRTHLGAFAEEMIAAYSAASTSTEQAIANTAATLRQRLPAADITPAELRERSWWTGPEIFVLIDDLDLIPEQALHPLIELLPHAQDIGLHLVVARKSGSIGRALYGPFLSNVKDTSPAVLLLDADKEEGAIFGIKPTPQSQGRGIWQVRGTNLGACQVATTPDMTSEGDNDGSN